MNVEPDPDDRQPPLILPLPGEKLSLLPGNKNASDQAGSQQAAATAAPESEARRIWLAAPVRELPLDTESQLKVEPGLVSASGPEKGVENRVLVAFDTFPDFAFEGVECSDNASKKITIRPGRGPGRRVSPAATHCSVWRWFSVHR